MVYYILYWILKFYEEYDVDDVTIFFFNGEPLLSKSMCMCRETSCSGGKQMEWFIATEMLRIKVL